MKRIYFISLLFLLASFSYFFTGCAKCKGEDPRARIINNGTKPADVQIKTSEGNTVNINGVEPGTTSEYKSYAAGTVTFTVTIDKNVYTKTVQMEQCYEYDIVINSDNNITSTPRDRND